MFFRIIETVSLKLYKVDAMNQECIIFENELILYKKHKEFYALIIITIRFLYLF